MIDVYNAVYTALAQMLRASFPGIYVTGEYTTSPPQFPCVAMDEVNNLPVARDSAMHSRWADITLRVRVFSNKNEGKRAQARAILAALDEAMEDLNFSRRTYAAQPDGYNATVYTIDTTYSARARDDGALAKN